ncbi:MAG: trigger factor [Patescibacteria group bacterium]
MSSSVRKLERGEVQIDGEIDAIVFESFRPAAVKNLNDRHTIKGFRPGQAPEKVLADAMGEETILNEMAKLAFSQAYPGLLAEHHIDAIGYPLITLTKLARGNPLGFSARTAVAPVITLGDYAAAARAALAEPVAADSKDDKNDEDKTADKHRLKIAQKITNEAKVDLPEVLIAAETNKILAEFRSSLEQAGLKFSDYLERIKKTEAELKDEWRPVASERLTMTLALATIAKKENISLPAEKITAEVERISVAYPDLDKEKVAAYVSERLMNEAVWLWLENQGKRSTSTPQV